jgi:hypothetical protein
MRGDDRSGGGASTHTEFGGNGLYGTGSNPNSHYVSPIHAESRELRGWALSNQSQQHPIGQFRHARKLQSLHRALRDPLSALVGRRQAALQPGSRPGWYTIRSEISEAGAIGRIFICQQQVPIGSCGRRCSTWPTRITNQVGHPGAVSLYHRVVRCRAADDHDACDEAVCAGPG